MPGPCPELSALTCCPQSREVTFRDKASPKLCSQFMASHNNCFTGNKSRDKSYVLLAGSRRDEAQPLDIFFLCDFQLEKWELIFI